VFLVSKKQLAAGGIGLLYIVGIAAGVCALLVYSTPLTMARLETCLSKKYFGQTVVDQPCLQKTVAILLKNNSGATVMDYLTASTSPSAIINNCHAIAHVVGKEMYRASSNLEAALAQCSAKCLDGCTHGAIGAAVANELGEEYDDEDIAHASTEEVEKIGEKYCAQFSLCHAIGHVLYMSSRDFPKALQGCKNIATGINRQGCYEGVFMEGSTTGESLGLLLGGVPTLAPLQEGNYAYPCNTVPAEAQKACFLYLPKFQERAFYEAGVSPTEKKLLALQTCEKFSPQARAYCFEGLGYRKFISRSSINNPLSYCAGVEQTIDTAACSTGVLLGFIYQKEYLQARNYCDSIGSEHQQNICYAAFFQTLDEQHVSFESLCAEPQSHMCAKKQQWYVFVRDKLPDNYFKLYSFLATPLLQP
jgi:hypothetical protein